jgi:hypothetical protein
MAFTAVGLPLRVICSCTYATLAMVVPRKVKNGFLVMIKNSLELRGRLLQYILAI